MRTKKWITGPDPHLHKMYVQFGYNRTSARQRGETWNLTWEQWRDAWLPSWDQRGRAADCLCLARIDIDGVWDQHNIHLITRKLHGQAVREHYQ